MCACIIIFIDLLTGMNNRERLMYELNYSWIKSYTCTFCYNTVKIIIWFFYKNRFKHNANKVKFIYIYYYVIL